MTQYIDKSALVAEIWKRRNKHFYFGGSPSSEYCHEVDEILGIINTLEVIDPYEQYIQYASIESGIKAHAEDYSFNIESELFNQLTKEQQALWRKEIEQACISGGYAGVELARDPRYKKNIEVKEVDLDKEIDLEEDKYHGFYSLSRADIIDVAKHFFELGIRAQKGE